jgi:hypothetical protein
MTKQFSIDITVIHSGEEDAKQRERKFYSYKIENYRQQKRFHRVTSTT